jgi:hypothetical protein
MALSFFIISVASFRSIGPRIDLVVAINVLFSQPRSRECAEACPKDDSPCEFDSFQVDFEAYCASCFSAFMR